MHYAVHGYMISDISNFFASPAFDRALAVHHFASILIVVLSLYMPAGTGAAVFNISILEFGSVWINVCALYPSQTTFWCRRWMYSDAPCRLRS